MKAICVDDERLLMEEVLDMCGKLPQIDEIHGFTRPQEALDYVQSHPADIALLDINMPVMNGIELALKIKLASPDTAVVFLTGHAEYAVEAFKVRASGYLLKPVGENELIEEVEHVHSEKHGRELTHVEVRTFGGFDLFVDGQMVTFRQSKSKELLAYLIDRRGSSVTRPEAFAVIYEDRLYDRPMQKQFDVMIRSLRDTLREYGVEEIFELKSGSMRVCPECLECDAYRFFDGDAEAVNDFRGEYMNPYPWADMTESYMTWKIYGER